MTASRSPTAHSLLPIMMPVSTYRAGTFSVNSGVNRRVRSAVLASAIRFAIWPLLLACAERPADDAPAVGGTLVISAFAEPDILLPPLTLSGQGQQVVDAVFDRLLFPDTDADGATRLVPQLAEAWAWTPDSLAIDFTLHQQARWHDGVPVTAADVRFTWQAYVDSALASPMASALANIDSVQVRDSRTARIWFARRSLDQLLDAATQMRILPAHRLDSIPRASWRTSAFARQPIGTGRFRFGQWRPASQLDVVADSANYRGRPGLDRVIWTVSPDPASATARLFAGEADFLESVRPDAVPEFVKHPQVTLLKSPSLVYGFLQFNLEANGGEDRPHPIFADRAVRRALSMLVDREAAVRAVFDSLARVAVGPMTRIHLGADTTISAIPHDVLRGGALLDSAGWRRAQPSGLRMRDGVPLRFTVLVPSSSSQRMRLAMVLQQGFRDAGVDLVIESLEFNALNARLGEGRFDAAMMAIGADRQPSGIRGVWGASAVRRAGGTNFGSYRSTEFNALLDSAGTTLDAAAARRLYRRAYDVVVNDAPAIWLYEPWNLSGVSAAITPVGVRPDGWWMQLAEWKRSKRP
jgi:peptide/nickel transport system substrate-binding protein